MKQHSFEAQYEPQWQALQRALQARPRALDNQQLPVLYRAVCQHLALARQRQYSPALQDRLNDLVLRGHQALYGTRLRARGTFARYLLITIPRTVRQQWRLVLAAALLFYGLAGALTWLVAFKPDLATAFSSPAQLTKMAEMYDPSATHWGRARESAQDLVMFGFYISHNITIAFQCFAGGLFAGVGSLFYLGFNAMQLGVVAGYLIQMGYGRPFWFFVATHSALEINGLILAAAAGLRLGLALIMPGRLPRAEALRQQAAPAATLIAAAALMTFGAAFFEAFWSSRVDLPTAVRFGMAGTLWTLVPLWLALGGRWSAPDAD
ncbi:stage II sporulation protein M [Amantichitinum ursilacus]|uniref:Stage II sporulation protein M n=1 Tax=Amantichitinum ursilacus TaxID=857265 RepID=A0A0N0XIN8_9NEIS|nr:stage II sporulation protein M [Amantichitinum ursilacus]KPC53067.1 hypothetical protein WG78_11270 [Amantichitinum ursilacus]